MFSDNLPRTDLIEGCEVDVFNIHSVETCAACSSDGAETYFLVFQRVGSSEVVTAAVSGDAVCLLAKDEVGLLLIGRNDDRLSFHASQFPVCLLKCGRCPNSAASFSGPNADVTTDNESWDWAAAVRTRSGLDLSFHCRHQLLAGLPPHLNVSRLKR